MRYKLFGHTGLRVSELCLGTMNFGEGWIFGIDKPTSASIFTAFAEAGGNYIDTADCYTDGLSEQYIGEFANSERDQFVISSKCSLVNRPGDPNAFGNSRKHVRRSVEASLRRLNMEHLDILWLHCWDFMTGAEEIMRGLEDLTSSGKVDYIGLSNAPSWLLAQANTLSEQHGWSRFAGVQLEYSLAQRSIEAEYFPLMDAFDLNLSAWSPLGGGILSGKYQVERGSSGRFDTLGIDVGESHRQLLIELDEIAAKMDCSMPQLALAWARQRNSRLVPIIGASSSTQLKNNLGCLDLNLAANDFKMLETLTRPRLQEPYGLLNRPDQLERTYANYSSRISNHRHMFPGGE